jgi:ubiquitin C-terminal hydrolase
MTPEGISNQGATCWFGSLIQCLRTCRAWTEDPGDDSFTQEFYKIVKSEPNEFLREFLSKYQDFQGVPNDSQEALFFILDQLEKSIGLKDFTGETTQTTTWVEGSSVQKYPCTIWLEPEKDLVISGYKDDTGKEFHVAIQQTVLSRKPKVLVTTSRINPPSDKGLTGLVALYGGHYVAFVRSDDEWFLVNDNQVHKASPDLSKPYYLSFHTIENGLEP